MLKDASSANAGPPWHRTPDPAGELSQSDAKSESWLFVTGSLLPATYIDPSECRLRCTSTRPRIGFRPMTDDAPVANGGWERLAKIGDPNGDGVHRGLVRDAVDQSAKDVAA